VPAALEAERLGKLGRLFNPPTDRIF